MWRDGVVCLFVVISVCVQHQEGGGAWAKLTSLLALFTSSLLRSLHALCSSILLLPLLCCVRCCDFSYGALMWSLGKVSQTPEVKRVYISSFRKDEFKVGNLGRVGVLWSAREGAEHATSYGYSPHPPLCMCLCAASVACRTRRMQICLRKSERIFSKNFVSSHETPPCARYTNVLSPPPFFPFADAVAAHRVA